MKAKFEVVHEILLCDLINKILSKDEDGTYIKLFGGSTNETWNIKDKTLTWCIKGSTGTFNLKLSMDDVTKFLGYKDWRGISKPVEGTDAFDDYIQFIGVADD